MGDCISNINHKTSPPQACTKKMSIIRFYLRIEIPLVFLLLLFFNKINFNFTFFSFIFQFLFNFLHSVFFVWLVIIIMKKKHSFIDIFLLNSLTSFIARALIFGRKLTCFSLKLPWSFRVQSVPLLNLHTSNQLQPWWND